MKRVLVTGGAGYIGSILCERLIYAGHKVTVLDNLMYKQQSLFHLCANSNFHLEFGNVCDKSRVSKLLRNVDVIIPLAAIVGAKACDRNAQLAQSVNLESVRLLNRLRSSNQLIIFPNTNSGYGTSSGDLYCNEETPLKPITLYGKTKVQAELELLDYSNVITLRLATVFGISPRMRLDLLVNHFVHAAVTDNYIVIFEKDFKRNYVHIRDVADCFLHAIENADEMIGHAYNLGLEDANLSKEELALKIKEHVPNFYIHFSEIGSDPDKRNYIVSNQKLADKGFLAKRSLDTGIQELLKGFHMMNHSVYKNT